MTHDQVPFSTGLQTYLTAAELGNLLRLSPRRIRQLAHAKLIRRSYRLLGGNRLQMVFFESDITGFMDEYFIRGEDLDGEEPKSPSDRFRMIKRIQGLHKLYANRATRARMNRRLEELYGPRETEDDPQARVEEPAILDRTPEQPRINQGERPSDLNCGLNEDRWEDEEEGKG